jgi:NADPH:quinone reductase-like Zn-dependent oxidoreductase
LKAVRFHEHGGTDKLRYEDAPAPKPGKNEALLQVKAVALNRLDLLVRQGVPAYPVQLPHILGSDIAGVVLQGDNLGALKAGDEVMVSPVKSCGQCQPCTTGRENQCLELKVIGGHIPGGYAEQVVVPSRCLVKKPAGLDWSEAAAFPLTYLTAFHMLATRAKLKAGETVLVVGASAGVSTAAIQLAKTLGARVLAHTSTPNKADRIKAIGADEVVTGHASELSSKVLALTDQHGVDVVFEHVGPATFQQSFLSTARGGRIVTCGATTGPEISIILRQLYMKEITLLGSYLGTVVELNQLLRLVEQGKIRPVVDKVFPLQEAAKAHELLNSKEHVGKIVLKVSD